MPFWRLFYHFNWAIKDREHLITPEIELRLYGFIRSEAKKLQAPLIYINGMPDHIHVLASVRPSMSPAEFVQQLKGASSHFITHQIDEAFEWQTDYAVLTVSEKEVPRIIDYIKNQKQHHAQATLWHELEKRGDAT